MMTEYKTITEKNTKKGRKKLEKQVAALAAEGYKVKSRNIIGNSFNAKKGCLLGFFFLPLVLFGIERGQVEVTMEKEDGK